MRDDVMKTSLSKIILAAVLDVLESTDPGDRDICEEGAELNQA